MFGKSIENRILVGVTSFVAIMVLVGWIAINEGGRMLAFDRQFNARSIERGAALFATNCTTCHGTDARGIEQRAPALNNPQLFGHDFLEPINTQIDTLTKEMAALNTELEEQSPSAERIAEIHARLGTGTIAAERYASIVASEADQAASEAAAEATEAAAPAGNVVASGAEPTAEASQPEATPTHDMAGMGGAEATATPSLDSQAEATAEAVTGETAAEPAATAAQPDEQTILQDELTALQAELSTEGITEERTAEINARITEINSRLGTDSIPGQLLALRSQRDTLLNSLQPAVDKGYDPAHPDRLELLGWAGGLDAFIYTTLIHGRPLSGQYWPQQQAMPAWSQTAGGPLRNDQLQDLTNYILNFDKGNNWTLEDLFAVNQFAIIPGAAAGGVQREGPPICPDPSTCDPAAVTAEILALAPDPQRGEAIYRQLGCVGCHVTQGGVTAPRLEGTWTRVTEDRLALPQFAGFSGEQYLVDSIVLPSDFTVPPYQTVMPTIFGQQLDAQMLADVVAYLKSQDGPSQE